MSFTPERSNSREIEPFELLQTSFAQSLGMYVPIVILASPSVVVAVLQAAVPSLKVPLSLLNSFLLTPLLSSASLYFVYRYLSTQTADLGGAIGKTMEKLPNLVIGFLLYLIAVIVGFVFFIVPGIYVALRLGFVLYAVMIDDLDAVAALKSSWNLVGGRWLQVFGAQLLAGICFLIPLLIISFVVGIVFGPKNIVLASTIGALFGLAATPFLSTYYTKLYLRLQNSDS